MQWSLRSIFASALVLLAANPVISCPVSVNNRDVLPLVVNTVYQFDNTTWNENLAVRENGKLLVTRLDTPILMQVDPTNAVAPVTVANFSSEYAGLLGITETLTDIFYVVAAAPFDDDFVKTSGVISVFKVDMNTFNLNDSGAITSAAEVTKVADISTAGFLNGMTTLNDVLGYVLIADSYNGVVYRLDVYTGNYTIIIDDDNMKYLSDSITNLGVNGLKIRDSYLYWSNSGNPIFCRIPINDLGEATGASEVVAAVDSADDFVFRADGTAWMAQNQIESLSVVKDGVTTLVAGNSYSTILAGVTAGAFGRLSTDSNILYLTTNGGLAIPVNGTIVVGGEIASIDTSVY
ncbi:hypothetical protein BJ878DRAFT_526185 [Calycina marina]|uniref:Six-bladed beta-propeller-like protein n=1 Tax=Calycina marina TaxID=1763456 RepID=A0A9P7YVB6_9HELO|nr:hypothetical protein BJ878DRAFT_526185 [Calycina marina]